MGNYTRLFDKKDFSSFNRNMSNDESLTTTLIRMQQGYGINDVKAAKNAVDLINDVTCHQTTEEMVGKDAREAFKRFFNESKMLECDRKLMLRKIHFGLGLYSDENLAECIQDGMSVNDLFEAYDNEVSDISADDLQEQILEQVSDYNISAGTMKMIANRLENSDNVLAASAAISEEALRFKCIAAMDLYLRYNDRDDIDMSMEDAVNYACTSIEVQAVADAVSKGEMARDVAKKILSAVFATSCVVGLAILLLRPMVVTAGHAVAVSSGEYVAREISSHFSTTGWQYLTFGGLALFVNAEEWLSKLIGTAVANIRYRYLIKKEDSEAAEAMDDMANEQVVILQEAEDADTDEETIETANINTNRNRHYVPIMNRQSQNALS